MHRINALPVERRLELYGAHQQLDTQNHKPLSVPQEASHFVLQTKAESA
ncbi:TPA: hypothetical protein ACMDNO_000741 [Vibrio cholerae]